MRKLFFNNFVPNQMWFSPKEAGNIIGKSDQFIRNEFVRKKIFGHIFNGKRDNNNVSRNSYMISRESLILYLSATANYTPNDFVDSFIGILKVKPTSLVLEIKEKIDKILGV